MISQFYEDFLIGPKLMDSAFELESFISLILVIRIFHFS